MQFGGDLPREKLIRMYRDMVRIRIFETTVIYECFPKGVLYGNFHPCIGQEAVAVGACNAINRTDYIISTHRGHGHCIAKGATLDRMMAEIYGKVTGYCKGRGGSLHVADVSLGILGANGIVGGGIPIAAGAALASKIKKTGQVVLGFFGDGASNEGTFHESLNMAAIWKLPIVFICENNQWACGTPYTDVINTQGVAERSVGYGIPGVRIDGNDVLEVWEAIRKAADRARNGEGPSLIECFTFRIAAHNSSDPESRPQELINEWKSKDPIKKFAMYLHKKGVSSTELESIEKDAKAEIQAACEFAEQSPYPDPREVDLFVYSQDNERSVSR